MIRRVNLIKHVRRYHWLLGGVVMVAALFLLASPPIPADLNYRYQLDVSIRNYPLVQPTAKLVEWSTERVREVYRWNLTAATVGEATPPNRTGADALTPATFFIILGVLGCVVAWLVPRFRMAGIGLIIFVIAGSHLVAHPGAYAELMAVPSTLIPNATATLVTHADPGHTAGVEREAAYGLKDLADRYFEQYVRFTERRHADPGAMFVTAKRWWFGVSGLIYVMPFALLLAVLSALTVLVQTLVWVFCLIAPFAIVFALVDDRVEHRPDGRVRKKAGLKVWRHVLKPLAVTMFLLGILGLVLPMVLFLATFVHAMESEIGRLLIGSIFPLMLVGLVLVLYLNHRQGGHRATEPPGALGSKAGATVTLPDLVRGEVPARAGRRLRDLIAHRRRAGERHLRDIRKR